MKGWAWAVVLVACGSAVEPVVVARWPEGAVRREADVVGGDTLAVRAFHANGQLERVEAYDAEGRKSGVWMAYYSDGRPWSEHRYEAGVQIGAYRTWHPAGALYLEGTYDAQGVPTGTWRFFGPDGQLAREIEGSEIAARTANPQ